MEGLEKNIKCQDVIKLIHATGSPNTMYDGKS